MSAAPELSLLLLAAIAALVFVALLFFFLGRRFGGLEARSLQGRRDAEQRQDAVKRSRAVLTGQIGEQLAPLLPDFPVDPADARFLGKPVDFIAFRGLSAGAPTELVFIEVKSGDARLTATERAIRDAIQAGKVRWVEYRLPGSGGLSS